MTLSMKRELCRLKRKSNLSGLYIDAEIYDNSCAAYNQCLLETKRSYYTSTVLGCAKDQGALFNLMNELLHKTSSSPLPSSSDLTHLANDFLDFFEGKIAKIHHHLTDLSDGTTPTTWPEPSPLTRLLKYVKTTTTPDLVTIIKNPPIKSRSWDSLPAKFLGKLLIEFYQF